jgi:2-amino-4-hydroxy-6-hydroxymethyldihydropteridine diphosphokinase
VEQADLPPDGPVPVALALGSNLGDRAAHLRAGVTALRRVIAVEAVSSVYATEPVGPAQPEFLNAALIGTTRLAPRPLLRAALAAEAAAGRRRTVRDAPRTLDIDVVLYGDRIFRTPDLVVPHPRWRERGFVLAPLGEIAPDWVDPETGLAVQVLAEGAELKPGCPRAVAPAEAITGWDAW